MRRAGNNGSTAAGWIKARERRLDKSRMGVEVNCTPTEKNKQRETGRLKQMDEENVLRQLRRLQLTKEVRGEGGERLGNACW